MATYIKEFILYSALLCFIFYVSFTKADAAEQTYYFGLSGGQTRVKNSATQQYQDATSFGVKFGMRLFANESVWTGSEINYTRTTAKEEVKSAGTTTLASYEAQTTGLYLLGRTRGKVYIKGKLGAANQLIRINDAVTRDTTRGSAGIGIGIRQGGAVLEIEYTLYGEGVTILSVGYVF